jgi:hypothetical protein
MFWYFLINTLFDLLMIFLIMLSKNQFGERGIFNHDFKMHNNFASSNVGCFLLTSAKCAGNDAGSH